MSVPVREIMPYCLGDLYERELTLKFSGLVSPRLFPRCGMRQHRTVLWMIAKYTPPPFFVLWDRAFLSHPVYPRTHSPDQAGVMKMCLPLRWKSCATTAWSRSLFIYTLPWKMHFIKMDFFFPSRVLMRNYCLNIWILLHEFFQFGYFICLKSLLSPVIHRKCKRSSAVFISLKARSFISLNF